ncbi:Uncharacterised protein [Brevundimonas diminuta]|nr:Uncharacterised protein [Brevundimonas diminuta]SUW14587.1 Uncharacterised protein [Brevundimonas diminuta]
MRNMGIVAAVVLSLFGPAHAQDAPSTDATVLPDLMVRGRPVQEAARDFVGRVGAPARGRGLALWRREICPGVVNLEREAAQAVIDRITQTAASLDLRTGEPGCHPNVVVIFTNDGRGLARTMNADNPRLFRQNVTGMHRDTTAFQDFLDAERPVRWWSLSLPVDSETGRAVVRMPGDAVGGIVDSQLAAILGCNPNDCVAAASPIVRRKGPGRLSTQVVDALFKTMVIVDTDMTGEVNTTQLGDYIALISLAQLDPRAETQGFDTILNLFSGDAQQGLTEWDRAYLVALYGPRPDWASVRAQAGAVADVMARDLRAPRGGS